MADKLLKSIKFPTLPDRYVIGDTSLSEEGAAAEAKAVGEALATKADTKGRYEDLIVGGAEQLMADGYETDTEPYLFRTTGGSADVGNREYLDKIVGGTVAWNQLVPTPSATQTINGVTFTVNADSSVTANGTATAQTEFLIGRVDYIANHKYAVLGIPSGASASTYWLRAIKGQRFSNAIDAVQTNDYWTTSIFVANGATVSNVTFRPQVIDLTALFNPTIADYIYSLEQSQAGAGVAWFRQYFPKDYYPYDPGTLRSVEGVSAHVTVGFNQWDEEWENGWWNYQTGVFTASSSYFACKSKIAVFPNTEYYWKCPTNVRELQYYDANGEPLGRRNSYAEGYANTTFTTPDGCYYLTFYFGSSYGTAYNNDICINLSDPSRNGEYEPYTKHTYPLDSSLTLRGVPKLADGKLAFDGDVYPPSGEVQRRYGIVDLGTLNWTKDTSGGNVGFYVNALSGSKPPLSWNVPFNAISKYFVTVPVTGYSQYTVDKTIFMKSNGQMFAVDNAYTDAATFKAAMSGVYMVYEKATPTTETADGYEQYQICDPSGTEAFVTTGIVPVGHETRYPHDLKKKIETAPDSPSTDGTYLMKRSGGKNTYMALPSTPSANGAYVLTVTVSGGSASYSWAAKE